MKLLTVLTARANSERMPNKALHEIDGRPLISWIIQRLKKLPGMLVLAVPDDEKNTEMFQKIGWSDDVNVFFGDPGDVVTRVTDAVKMFMPDADYIFRALGDCPFIDIDIVSRSVDVMRRTGKEAFLWNLDPQTWPVYGAREFPFAKSAWVKIHLYAKGDEREHVDLYFHNNRSRFNIAYHEPPPSVYFRPYYRLEIDWPEDMKLVQVLAKQVGMNATLPEVIKFMDSHIAFSKYNRERVEITGPTVSYDYGKRREWMKAMRGQPVIRWDNSIIQPPDQRATAVFCNSGRCQIGYGWEGTLYTEDDTRIVGEAYVSCSCGAGKYWNKPRGR